MTAGTYTRRLHLAAQQPWRALLNRLLLVTALLIVAWVLLWVERDGLRDNGGAELGAMDVLYFAVVTVTTLGYGDIVPVSPEARAMVAFGITPLRVLIWLLLLSTAYELTLRKSIEKIEMRKLKRSLKNHIVICGFGVKGRSAMLELLERGVAPESIIVIDSEPMAIAEANRMGANAFLGNAASEDMLRDVAIDKASEAIVVPNNDEACVLICLTIRELAPTVKIRAAARQDENVKLIERCGADTVIAPSVSAGRLLASATIAPLATGIIEELLAHGQGADLVDHAITEAELGLTLRQIQTQRDWQILAVRTAEGKMLSFSDAVNRKLELGDKVVAFRPSQ
ncbi:MAG: potassium channel family protein [Fimbriimonadaceae bacterium]|nr:potassium channel family protein [Fimbriimonadaceae bacterium]